MLLVAEAQGLLLCMVNCAFAFFMFGYQVHEKAVLLLLLPATLLADAEPLLAAVLPPVAAFSMWPLLSRDGLQLAYVGSLIIYAAVMLAQPFDNDDSASSGRGLLTADSGMSGSQTSRLADAAARQRTRCFPSVVRYLVLSSVLGAFFIHATHLFVLPPARYPYLLDALFSAYAFLHLALAFIYSTWRQCSKAGHVKVH